MVATAATALRGLEASPRGIPWVQRDPANTQGWAAAKRAVPFLEPLQEPIGAGLSDAAPAWLMGYRYPMITVPADASGEEVCALMQALAGTSPMGASFHGGAIRYLREAGQRTAEHQSWPDAMVQRHQALQRAWAEFLPEARGRNLSEEELGKAWGERRPAALAALT